MGDRNMPRAAILFFALASFAGCGDDGVGEGGAGGAGAGGQGAGGSSTGGSDEGAGAPQGGDGAGGMTTENFVAGGERPVDVLLPTGYDPSQPTPLLLLLHGYAADAAIQDGYFVLSSVAAAQGLVFAAPNGTLDEGQARFWNATDACCDFYASGVDDSAYLESLIDEIGARVNIDPNRVYVVGHSNGGFMSYRMACDHADRIAAIVSLAGATFEDERACGASGPVSVLQIHGTEDTDILYEGGVHGSSGVVYPGALESVQRWAQRGGCGATPVAGEARDLELEIEGAETTVDRFEGCDGASVELWTIQGGGHIPSLVESFGAQVVTWLLLQSK